MLQTERLILRKWSVADAAAYALRSLGKQTDGEKIAPEIKRIFGFVPDEGIVCVF